MSKSKSETIREHDEWINEGTDMDDKEEAFALLIDKREKRLRVLLAIGAQTGNPTDAIAAADAKLATIVNMRDALQRALDMQAELRCNK